MCQQPAIPLLNHQIVFYGAGSMAEAIVRGMIARNVVESGNIVMLNRSSSERLSELRSRYGVLGSNDPEQKNEYLRTAPVIVLAMKPKDAAEALRSLGPLLSPDQLVISMIAGMTIRTMQGLLGKSQPVVRTMPNTSSSIGLGATGIAYSKEVDEQSRRTALNIFEAVGLTSVIDEERMETLTGISGSGPAYIYYMMEAMIAAGIRGGLPAEQSRELTVQTVLGAARMVQQTGEEPAALRKKVTSPNGSTQAALEVLEKGDFFETVISAVNRCAERSREMGLALEKELS
ncbi:pyrroline-5-carboxylate reductase [Paenibacillus sonchi]|uniref:Pyrroline-5-carboxylate reductase n=3 Tax=Paenibacillus sonchi group TaxID=2044880 RepID=A0A974SCA1_9BACL|nr:MULTISPECIES: pyrroline-5-carboxylate reductase [Paenibacillus sonchi group]KWX74729.1 pyrroline-5-carboxylate reductase [Paenibacillus riograndensis]KWX88622.1 pyrroline-5-carboxylate reductase [Paenibacillus riograndensis]MCE3201879.1 pyrroline-5-carboxylate reductase [Paenibacillus sonchi]QQZ60642.1 pyrroline-5-carboxylate reductase [Paenibacillus sonchi]CQR56826.1 pyrroline-5-carboxylate reductase [Paenibacillus riograndensis SBR5]